MTNLADLQAWLQAQLTGKTANEQPSTTVPLQQIIKTKGVPPAQRLRVYTSGYYLRLLECLQGDFPMLRAFLSDEVFGLFARGYIYSVGSQSFSLLDFSKKFPDFLLQMSPPAQHEEEWKQYRFPYELACLERLMIEVATDRGFENRPQYALDNNIWMAFHTEQSFEAPPCLRLMEANFDLSAFMDDPLPPEERLIPPQSKTFLALHRRNYRLQKHILEPWQYHLLHQIKAGETSLNSALEKIAPLTRQSLGELRAALLFFLPFCEEQQLLFKVCE